MTVRGYAAVAERRAEDLREIERREIRDDCGKRTGEETAELGRRVPEERKAVFDRPRFALEAAVQHRTARHGFSTNMHRAVKTQALAVFPFAFRHSRPVSPRPGAALDGIECS